MLVALKASLVSLPLLAVSTPAMAARDGRASGLSQIRPNAEAIPGGEQAASLLGGFMYFALAAAVGSLVVCAGMLGWGKARRSPTHMEWGSAGIFWTLVGAVGIGGAVTFVNWAFNLGMSIQ